MSTQPPTRSRRWTRSYPPLILLLAAMAIAVLVLPSALNLPQSQPNTVLEYAPVPPEDDEPPPPIEGNVQALGLGSSGTVAKSIPPKLPPPPDTGIGGRPQEKRCVGTPPRQTEDPVLAALRAVLRRRQLRSDIPGREKGRDHDPCVLRCGLVRLHRTDRRQPPAGTYIDINKKPLPACPKTGTGTSNTSTDPNQCDFVFVRMLRGFSRYFNDRFQTYDRKVHYHVYISSRHGSRTAE